LGRLRREEVEQMDGIVIVDDSEEAEGEEKEGRGLNV